MKAPDKIYMPNELLSEDWERHIEGEDTCYIRKDALLEWANNWKQLGQSEDFMYAIETLVSHLNSM